MSETLPTFEQFSALAQLPCRHGFVGRAPALDVQTDRAEALSRLENMHRQTRAQLGLDTRLFVTAEQVHGNRIGVLRSGEEVPDLRVAGVDGLITDRLDLCLGIYVADCGALYLVDPVRRVVGLVHSGRKGTELGIVGQAVAAMGRHFGSDPATLVAQLGPCIRPPWYEVDFAAQIVDQCKAGGLRQIMDCGVCTASHPSRYYSYRREQGRTGRMLALLGLV